MNVPSDPSEIYSDFGLQLPRYTFQSWGGYILCEYECVWAHFPVDERKPHIACFLFDSNEPPPGNRPP